MTLSTSPRQTEFSRRMAGMVQFNAVANKVAYSRKLVNASISGIRNGQQIALNGQPLPELLFESARDSLKLAAVGACVGLLLSYLTNRRSLIPSRIACGSFGSALGFCAGFAWKTRKVTSSVARSTRKEMGRVRNERWLEMNPIDYA